jgi:hypothetical protein
VFLDLKGFHGSLLVLVVDENRLMRIYAETGQAAAFVDDGGVVGDLLNQMLVGRTDDGTFIVAAGVGLGVERARAVPKLLLDQSLR